MHVCLVDKLERIDSGENPVKAGVLWVLESKWIQTGFGSGINSSIIQ